MGETRDDENTRRLKAHLVDGAVHRGADSVYEIYKFSLPEDS